MSEVPATGDAPQNLGYETEDVDVGRAWRVVAGLAATVVLTLAGLGVLLHGLTRGERGEHPPLTRQQTAPVSPPAPHLQAAPFVDVTNYDREQRASLSGYAYLDGARRRARIPIDRAMALTIGKSLDP